MKPSSFTPLFPARLLLCAVLCSTTLPALAEQTSKPGSTDARVRTVVYNARDVVKITGHYGYQTLIQFADYERIENISIGDSLSWQVVPNEQGNLLFVKPIEENAETNLTIVTALPASAVHASPQRIYTFALEAKQSTPHRDQDMTWTLRFHYPQDDAELLMVQRSFSEQSQRALVQPNARGSAPADWNFNYSFSGDTAQVPVRIFDNGQFTYFEFDERTDTPAIFLVDSGQNESLVNYQVEGRYLVVHRIGRQFTLRNGNTVTCIFNDAYSGEPALDMNSPRNRDEGA